ncbi:hypothetical protein CR194_05090 [Salipaludibacillus keqinensis]|uniref:DUF5590 domain-containing protein n=1 Tax=Salipaludibacillus keqinensis TaxID=2045207 RepID=A0A323TJG9_9BACI|nr:hypothetical protein [Salipaludibacillus keqinensis]PYZ94899.1 hypothetical protein CR194_05090 [Salipaludibacillus keqinensis]
MLLKRICKLFCFTLIILLMTACSSESREEAMRAIESTNLSNESIDDIKVGMSINDKSFITKHGYFEPYPNNEHYATQRNYDQYWNKDYIVSVDRQTQEILQVGVLEENNTSSTAMEIKRGFPIDKVITAYGENYFTYEDKEQTIYIIGYVDHQNNLELSFVHFDDKVTGINIGYAFD